MVARFNCLFCILFPLYRVPHLLADHRLNQARASPEYHQDAEDNQAYSEDFPGCVELPDLSVADRAESDLDIYGASEEE